MSGRYVIVQMDNGEGIPLNLKEVRAFGSAGNSSDGVIFEEKKVGETWALFLQQAQKAR